MQEYKDLYPEDKIRLNPNVPEELHEQAKIELQGYYAHCTATDLAIGGLLDKIKEEGLFDKSIIMTNLALFTLKLLPLYIPISLLYYTEHFCLT